MIPLDIAGVAEVVGGRLADCPDPSTPVTGAVADSRQAGPGDLYVAIVGERVDGHDFAAQAHGAGAVVTLGSRPTGQPTIVVDDDPVAALGRLASHVLAQVPQAHVVALTGSSGKTTTKDLVAGLLEDLGPTIAPAGSLNTEVGLPLTVLRATPETRFVVLEMGARGVGHIATLCRIAPPDVSVVLNVGSAHVGEFGGRQAIAQAKGEIIEALSDSGTAILNADDPLVLGMAPRTRAQVTTFGARPDAEVRAVDLVVDEHARAGFTLHTPEGSAPVAMRMVGEHMASNALAAAAVARRFGMPVDRIAALLSAATSRSQWRMEVTTTPDRVTVINDAYNANPESMRAALRALAAMGRGRRTFAVLGEMRELGEHSIAEHDEIGRLAVRLDIGLTIAVGDGARPLFLGAAQEGSWDGEAAWVPDAAAALEGLRAELRPGDVVLVKASRSIGLEQVAQGLMEGSA